jgi:hypothetical protein
VVWVDFSVWKACENGVSISGDRLRLVIHKSFLRVKCFTRRPLNATAPQVWHIAARSTNIIDSCAAPRIQSLPKARRLVVDEVFGRPKHHEPVDNQKSWKDTSWGGKPSVLALEEYLSAYET